MKATPRQTRRFLFVIFNLMGIAFLIISLTLSPLNNSLPFTLLDSLLIIMPVLLIVFVNVVFFHQLRRVKRYQAPHCPVCNSADVSFAGKVTDVSFQNSRLAINLALLGIVGVVVQALVMGNLLPRSVQLGPCVLAVPLIGVAAQLLALGLTELYRKASKKRSDGRIHWVCENRKHDWVAEEGVPVASGQRLIG